jgi:hypothetical protein
MYVLNLIHESFLYTQQTMKGCTQRQTSLGESATSTINNTARVPPLAGNN